jgi:murein DD-endopeptidase MepM/ murein hydrolase activator NlpD
MWLAYVLVAVLATAGAYRLGYQHGNARPVAGISESAPAAPLPAPDATAAAEPEAPPESAQPSVKHGVVRSGDTMSELLRDYLSAQEIHDLAQQSKAVFALNRICAGQPYEVCEIDGGFSSFRYEIDREEQLVVVREGTGFRISREPIPYEVKTDLVRGAIRSNLFEAVNEIGEGPDLALALADIFAWDVDFLQDIREGDTFQALVEKRSRDGNAAGYGRVLAAQFVNQGDRFDAVWYQDGDRAPGYYDLGGNSLRKAFLKAPLSFTRISSGYSKRRFHPIAKTWRAHPAIDYAAPPGTPIKTVGDGVVEVRGYTNGNGNYVKIRHNSTYETLYLHMSRFAKGIAKGKRVSQGEVIGYVGSTGLATGPHLCFRMYQNGSPINPLKMRAPPSEPVSTEHMADFEALASRLTARFESERTDQARLGR